LDKNAKSFVKTTLRKLRPVLAETIFSKISLRKYRKMPNLRQAKFLKIRVFWSFVGFNTSCEKFL